MKLFGTLYRLSVAKYSNLEKWARFWRYTASALIFAFFLLVILFFTANRPIALDLDIVTEAVEFELNDQLVLNLKSAFVNTAPIDGDSTGTDAGCISLGRRYFDLSKHLSLIGSDGGGDSGIDIQADTTHGVEAVFPVGTRLRVSLQLEKLLRFEVLSANAGAIPSFKLHDKNLVATRFICMAPGSDVEISNTDAAKDGLLVLDGNKVRFGISSHNANRLNGALKSGEYRILEDLAFVDGFTEVQKNQLKLGEEVEVISSDSDQSSVSLRLLFSFATPEDKGRGIHVHAQSGIGHYQLVISRGENFSKSIIKSRWYDRALHDPAILGATAVLVLILMSLELVLALRLLIGNSADETKKNEHE